MGSLGVTPAAQTGNQDIDAQVRTLLSIANDVLFSKRVEESALRFQRALGFFVTYLDYHFASEEVVMAGSLYPGRRLHADIHAHLRQEAVALENQGSGGSLSEARRALLYMVEDRLYYHVQDDDQLLADFLNKAKGRHESVRLPGICDLRERGTLAREFDDEMLQELVKLGHPEPLPWMSAANT
jgi:hemerythrin-like metal-binding protein